MRVVTERSGDGAFAGARVAEQTQLGAIERVLAQLELGANAAQLAGLVLVRTENPAMALAEIRFERGTYRKSTMDVLATSIVQASGMMALVTPFCAKLTEARAVAADSAGSMPRMPMSCRWLPALRSV